MKTLCHLLIFLPTALAIGQVVPTTPTKFTTRSLGSSTTGSGMSSASAGASVTKPEPVVRTITYLTLSGARQWTSTDGKPLVAKLIAFEDIVVETKVAPAVPAAAPILPAKVTVVRDGKVRLFANNKAYELAVDRLSAPDREFIETVQRAVVAKPITEPAPAAR